ncbi:MAG: hypothetical protein LBB57_04355, partial [Clostridiales Family XIII bacterium]|nr:hypothetical protein [Clostridiales Family XIII bacterium]
AGKAAPVALYGTVPMAFSEFFHDITANINAVKPSDTSFAAGGTVAAPIKFITQGTRTGSPTYAEGDKLAKVDVVSSATYGDDVHFVPEGNLTLDGSDRKQKTDPNAAITGIKKVEVGVSFDLYANALLLRETGTATGQSANVLAKAATLDISAIQYADGSYTDVNGDPLTAPPIYKPKYLFPDGSFGKRAETALNANAAEALPGTEIATEEVAYGGNWGDKVTGVSFGTLATQYAGANYWDNFAEYLYGGYIEDSTGHREPLVFLQNIFSHRMHEDFDIAISPSRFARLSNLKTPDIYTVHVYAYGFEDIEATFYMKDYVNGGATIDTATYTTSPGGIAKSLYISGIDNFAGYNPDADFSIVKGSATVSPDRYTAEKEGNALKLTLKSSLFEDTFQGSYTVRIVPDTDAVASKTLSFSLVKEIERPKLTLNSDRQTDGADAAAQASAIAVTKSDKLYFTNDEFASALIISGRSGYTSIKEAGSSAAAAAIGDAAAKRDGSGQPYYLDLSASVFESGKTYEITANATGFEVQTYYIAVTTP